MKDFTKDHFVNTSARCCCKNINKEFAVSNNFQTTPVCENTANNLLLFVQTNALFYNGFAKKTTSI